MAIDLSGGKDAKSLTIGNHVWIKSKWQLSYLGTENRVKLPRSYEISKFRREQLGFVFQDFNLLDTFSLKDNIFLPLVLAKCPHEKM